MKKANQHLVLRFLFSFEDTLDERSLNLLGRLALKWIQIVIIYGFIGTFAFMVIFRAHWLATSTLIYWLIFANLGLTLLLTHAFQVTIRRSGILKQDLSLANFDTYRHRKITRWLISISGLTGFWYLLNACLLPFDNYPSMLAALTSTELCHNTLTFFVGYTIISALQLYYALPKDRRRAEKNDRID